MSDRDRRPSLEDDRELYGIIVGVTVTIFLLSIVVAYALRSFPG